MQRDKIGFVGEGWGAVAAVRDLQKYFDLQYLTPDKDVINELSGNHNGITSFDLFNCNIIICAGYKPLISKELVTKYKIRSFAYA